MKCAEGVETHERGRYILPHYEFSGGETASPHCASRNQLYSFRRDVEISLPHQAEEAEISLPQMSKARNRKPPDSIT